MQSFYDSLIQLESRFDVDKREPIFILRDAFRKGQQKIAQDKLLNYLKQANEVDELLKPLPTGSLIHYACIHGWTTIVSQLIDLGFDIENSDMRGDSCLSLACTWNHEELALFLLEKGANITVQNHQGNTPLHGACRRGMHKFLERVMALKQVFDVNIQNLEGESLLHACIQPKENNSKDNVFVWKLLLRHPQINTHIKDNQGRTACELAVQLDAFDYLEGLELYN